MHTLPPLKRSPFPFRDGKAKCKIADENGLFSVECEEWSVELWVASLRLYY